MENAATPLRKDIPLKYKWNAESVFPSLEAFETELQEVISDLSSVTSFQGQLAEGPDVLGQALEASDQLVARAYKLYMYASVSHEVDKTDAQLGSLVSKAQAMFGQVLGAVSFISPEIIAIGLRTIDQWLQTDAALKVYTQYLKNLFRMQSHVRSAEVEELLGMLANPFSGPSNTYGFLTEADFRFEPAQDSAGQPAPFEQSTFDRLMSSPDRTLRRTAWEHYLDSYVAYRNTLTSNLSTSISQNVFMSRARKHTSSLEMSLFQNNVPVPVFHNLIQTFRKHLPTWRRYFEVRRRALGVERLEPYDIWAPLTSRQPVIPYEQAVEWICEGLAPLGREYTETIRRGCLQDRWVDVYPNQGKTASAFSTGLKGTHPFIVTSYTDDIFSLSTLAHELGHSMHSYLTWQNQPLVYSDYSLFVAEVASNFHQAMVRAHLLNTQTDRDFQISLIEEAMANFYRYFLIMPTLARFELEAHRRIENGEGLNADQATGLLADLYEEVYGDTVHVDRERVGMLWATFSHLFADYYVYQYATGISGANALSRRILSGKPNAAQDYLGFLKSGSSVYPLEALKRGGVDLSTPAPVEETFAVLASLVDRLEKLVG